MAFLADLRGEVLSGKIQTIFLQNFKYLKKFLFAEELLSSRL